MRKENLHMYQTVNNEMICLCITVSSLISFSITPGI